MRRVLAVFLALTSGFILLAGPALAADEPKSGTQPGEQIPGPFQPFNATGPSKDKFHCLVCEYGLHPVVMIFVRGEPGEPDKPLGKLMQRLDTLIGQDTDSRLKSFVVFLNDKDRTELSKDLVAWATVAKVKNVVLSSFPVAGTGGPESYKIDKETEVMVVIYSRLKVVKNYTFMKDGLDEKAVDAIAADVEKLVPMKK